MKKYSQFEAPQVEQARTLGVVALVLLCVAIVAVLLGIFASAKDAKLGNILFAAAATVLSVSWLAKHGEATLLRRVLEH